MLNFQIFGQEITKPLVQPLSRTAGTQTWMMCKRLSEHDHLGTDNVESKQMFQLSWHKHGGLEDAVPFQTVDFPVPAMQGVFPENMKVLEN